MKIHRMRTDPLLVLFPLAMSLSAPARSDAGCGCRKSPRSPAEIRPHTPHLPLGPANVVVTICGSGDFTGSFVGGAVQLSDGARVHDDVSLRGLPSSAQ